MIKILKKLIKFSFNTLGYDIIRLNNNPEKTLLGLRNFHIRTIIDIGANEGQFAKYISQVFPEAHLYCFEPIPEAFEKLKKWAEKERKSKVSIFNLALGEQDGSVEMFLHTQHTSSSSLLKTTEVCEKYYPFTKMQSLISVKMTTLDNWINSLSKALVPEILIKLDVQGYEDRVIRGGKQLFNMAKAVICEINLDKLYESQAEFKYINDLLYTLGFSYAGNLNQSYAKDGHVIFIDAVFVRIN